MKTLLAFLMALTFFVGRLGAQISELPMGSLERVMHYSVTNVTWIEVAIVQPDIYGENKTIAYLGQSKKFSTKAELDEFFLATLLKEANKMLTNSKPKDFNRPFLVGGIAGQSYGSSSEIKNFVVGYVPITVLKYGTNYTIPDLSGIKLELPQTIKYRIRELSWVRVEVKGETGYPEFTSDSGWGEIPEFEVSADGRKQFLALPLDRVTMGTNSALRLKVSIVSDSSHDFQIFDSMGQPMEERIPKVEIVSFATARSEDRVQRAAFDPPPSVALKLSGEPGRIYRVSWAASLEGPWNILPDTSTIFPSYSGYAYPPVIPGNAGFFRITSVPGIPDYTK